MIYLVRIRDVLTGMERWLVDSKGRRFESYDRRIADCMALGACRFSPTEFAYVVEIDPIHEIPI